MSDPIYTPKDLRALADRPPHPFLLDELRKALRWSADVIEAADEVIGERAAAKGET